jgi:hypothetical protein
VFGPGQFQPAFDPWQQGGSSDGCQSKSEEFVVHRKRPLRIRTKYQRLFYLGDMTGI